MSTPDDWDSVYLAVQNTVVERNRLDALDALGRLREHVGQLERENRVLNFAAENRWKRMVALEEALHAIANPPTTMTYEEYSLRDLRIARKALEATKEEA